MSARTPEESSSLISMAIMFERMVALNPTLDFRATRTLTSGDIALVTGSANYRGVLFAGHDAFAHVRPTSKQSPAYRPTRHHHRSDLRKRTLMCRPTAANR